MLKISLALVMATLSFCLTACGSTPKVDTKRFLAAKKLIDKLPDPAVCLSASADLFEITDPEDTSGGIFKTLRDVGEQDAAIAAHYPILKTRFGLVETRVTTTTKTNAENRADYIETLGAIRMAIDAVIADEKSRQTLNPFD